MSEGINRIPPDAPGQLTAGAMLRQARQARGLHIAALATSIKVAPRKLELLEADRYDELLDLTFARALAQTVCRSLKIDPAPVLALLPKKSGEGLGHVEPGINTPFMDRPGRPGRVDTPSWLHALQPRWLLPGLLVLAAAAVYFFPGNWRLGSQAPAEALPQVSVVPSASIAAASAAAVELQPSVVELLPPADSASTATVAVAVAPAQPVAPVTASPLLELRVGQSSWVEVQDATNKSLLARLVQAGEVVNLEGAVPLRLKVGNASSTTVRFRGQAVDLTPSTRDNVARLELK